MMKMREIKYLKEKSVKDEMN